ncbi:MAG: transposase [Proteobacteria bacterium]|nr:transposase [Pseudomonadota bacterium]
MLTRCYVAKRKFTEEKVLQILKEAEASSVAAVCRKYNVSGVTFYRWRTQYEGLKLSEAKKLRDLEDENRKLKKIVADLSLDIHGLKEVIRKKL